MHAAAKLTTSEDFYFASAKDLVGCPEQELPAKLRDVLNKAAERESVIVPLVISGHWLYVLIKPRLHKITIFDSHLSNLVDREVEVYDMVLRTFAEPLGYDEPVIAQGCHQQETGSRCHCIGNFATNLLHMLNEMTGLHREYVLPISAFTPVSF